MCDHAGAFAVFRQVKNDNDKWSLQSAGRYCAGCMPPLLPPKRAK